MTSSNDRRNSERSIVEDSFEKELRDRARERLQEREDALHGAQHSTPQRKSKVGTEGKATLNGRHARHEAPSDALAPASPRGALPFSGRPLLGVLLAVLVIVLLAVFVSSTGIPLRQIRRRRRLRTAASRTSPTGRAAVGSIGRSPGRILRPLAARTRQHPFFFRH